MLMSFDRKVLLVDNILVSESYRYVEFKYKYLI
jgi:hypothetical protein